MITYRQCVVECKRKGRLMEGIERDGEGKVGGGGGGGGYKQG